jgi:predicted transcriptional regulator
MKNHSGIRPQDILILLKIAAKKSTPWLMRNLANELGISPSEISESLNRSMLAGLLAADKQKLMTASLLEFLQFGLKYVYPQKPGSIVRGMPTSHSAPPLNKLIKSEEHYVWPYAHGQILGQSIEPLYKTVPKACEKDSILYELLALTDALRIGKSRERNLAITELKERLS